MGVYAIKPLFQKFLDPVLKLLIKYKVHPTTLNIFALLISFCAGISFYFSFKYPLALLLIPVFAFLRTASNALDGMVARKLNIDNQAFGEVLNELFDRIADSAFFIGLALTPFTNMKLGFFTLVVILLNSYLSILSKAAGGSRQYGGFMGKADRMIYISILAFVMWLTQLYYLADFFLWFTLFGTGLTLLQRFMQTKKELYT